MTTHQRDPSGSPSQTQGGSVEVQLQAQRDRLRQLQELHALRQQEEELRQRLDDVSPPRRRRRHHDSSSSSEGEIRVKSITRLRITSSYRQRDDWISDLQRAFEGARRKYRQDYRKILLAVDNMDDECRAKWERHLQASPPERQRIDKDDWPGFKQWSLSILTTSVNQKLDLVRKLEDARQRVDQSPAAFQNYLESLEGHFPRESDEEIRAYKYFAKLSPEIRDHFDRTSVSLPKSREEIVALATRFWATRSHPTTPLPPTVPSLPVGGPSKTPKADSALPKNVIRRQDLTRPANRERGETEPPHTRQNRVGTDGKLTTCFLCGAEDHWANQCPQRSSTNP